MHDLHATILHLLGLDHERLTYRYAGRNFRLTDVYGDVVHGPAGVTRAAQPRTRRSAVDVQVLLVARLPARVIVRRARRPCSGARARGPAWNFAIKPERLARHGRPRRRGRRRHLVAETRSAARVSPSL